MKEDDEEKGWMVKESRKNRVKVGDGGEEWMSKIKRKDRRNGE